jgi:3-oxoacyl-[acyl-carrier-protein] synthase-3
MSQVRRYARIVGWGKYVPSTVITNDDLAHMVDTSDEWIRTRTGIAERHTASSAESVSTMSVLAAQRALEVANCDPAALDLIIVATVTPDYTFPASACLVQDALAARRAGAFDLSAGCSGFVYGLAMAADGIAAGSYNTALVIGAETLSRVVDWTDRSTCVLFGDGAGAVLLQASDQPSGVLSSVLGSDGSGGDLLILPKSGYREPPSNGSGPEDQRHLLMNGNEIYRFATRMMATAAQQAVQKAGLTLDKVDMMIPHQANLRIIQSAAKHLKLPEDKVFVNLQKYGNTSAASVPIALAEAADDGKLTPGNILVLAAFGAGLTWAAATVRWDPLPVKAKGSRWTAFVRALRLRLAPLRSGAHRTERRLDTVLGGLQGDTEVTGGREQRAGRSKQQAASSKVQAGSREQGAGSKQQAPLDSAGQAESSKPDVTGGGQQAPSSKPEAPGSEQRIPSSKPEQPASQPPGSTPKGGA